MAYNLTFVDMTHLFPSLSLSFSDMAQGPLPSQICHRLSHSRGHDMFDSFLIPLIVGHGPRSFLLSHALDFHIRGHEVFDSFLIPLIFRHGPSSFRLRHVLDAHIRVDMKCVIPSLSLLFVGHALGSFLLRHVLDSHTRGHAVFDSFLIPLIVGHGLGSFLLRHVLDSKVHG